MRSTQWGLLKGQLEKLLRKLWIDLTVACMSCKLDGYYPNYPSYYCGQYRQRRVSLFLISQAGLHSLQAPSVPNDLGIKWSVFRCGWGRPNGGGVQGCVKEKRRGRRREWRDTAWKRQHAHWHTLAYTRTSITNQCFTNPNQQITQEGISSAQPLDMTVHAMRTCRKLRDFHRVHWRNPNTTIPRVVRWF